MRIVVVWPEGAHPELRSELESMTPRVRAERLRTLATIGLFIARGYGTQTTLNLSPTNHESGKQQDRTDNSKAFTQMMGKLKGSLT